MEIINLENGIFSLDSEMIIRSDMSFEQINSFGIDKKSENVGNGYKWIYIKNFEINELYFFISICCFESKVIMISFSFYENSQNDNDLEKWSENEELNNYSKFEEWLNKTIGVNRNFIWGNISSNYDSKSQASTITINYSNYKN